MKWRSEYYHQPSQRFNYISWRNAQRLSIYLQPPVPSNALHTFQILGNSKTYYCPRSLCRAVWAIFLDLHDRNLCPRPQPTRVPDPCLYRSMPWIRDRRRRGHGHSLSSSHGCGLAVECGCNGRNDSGRLEGNRLRKRKGMRVLHITSISSQ